MSKDDDRKHPHFRGQAATCRTGRLTEDGAYRMGDERGKTMRIWVTTDDLGPYATDLFVAETGERIGGNLDVDGYTLDEETA